MHFLQNAKSVVNVYLADNMGRQRRTRFRISVEEQHPVTELPEEGGERCSRASGSNDNRVVHDTPRSAEMKPKRPGDGLFGRQAGRISWIEGSRRAFRLGLPS